MIQFYRAIPDARHPEPASKSAKGALPTKAMQYCKPVQQASAFGWYIYAAHDLTLEWDGETSIRWWFDGVEGRILNGHTVDTVEYPDFPAFFDDVAPPRCKGYAPPWFAALQEPGLVQLWTGWLVRTEPGTGALLRPVANRPRPVGYELYEGIFESDTWFGPLFTNLRLTKTHQPVVISARYPLAQLQVLPREVYTARHEAETRVLDARDPIHGWDPNAWRWYTEQMVDKEPR